MHRFIVVIAVLLVGVYLTALQSMGAPSRDKSKGLEQDPLGRVLTLTDVMAEAGPGKIWICSDPDCPEGCNSKDPVWGNGLILEESRRLQGK